MVKLISVLVLVFLAVALVTGCSQDASQIQASLQSMVDLAESGNAEGQIQVTIDGAEFGLKEAVYAGGGTMQASLKFKFAEDDNESIRLLMEAFRSGWYGDNATTQ